MNLASRLRAALACAIALLLAGGTIGAVAVTPDAGPTAGQTQVTGDVPPGLTFTQIAGGSYHSVAIGADGLVYAWGRNNGGQLGNGTKTDSATPLVVPLPAGLDVIDVAAGLAFSAVLTADGTVYTWGNNVYGQLGIGSTTESLLPVEVPLPAGVQFTSIAAGYFHLIATAADGTGYAWGYNNSGQLADGTMTSAPSAVAMQLPAGVTYVAIDAGGYHSAALGSDGAVYSWGDNRAGQLGDGTVSTGSPVPVAALLPAGVTATTFSTGYDFTTAAGSDGVQYTWGSGGRGQLGDGGNASSAVPVVTQLPAGITLSATSSGEYYTLGIGSDGAIYAWGENDYGQLGDGTTTQARLPVTVQVPPGITFDALFTGFAHSAAIGSDGNVYTWGYGTFGQLANGATANSSLPALAVEDVVTVLEVRFDTLPGTALAQSGDTFTVLTPAHPCGPADVEIDSAHSFGQVGNRTTTDGIFTYGSAPVISRQPPAAVEVASGGGTVSISAAADGDEAPTVQWQQQAADGSWTDLADQTAAALTLAVTEPTTLRAVFTNCLGVVATDSTVVTLAAPEPTPTPTPSPSVEPTTPPTTPPAAGGESTGSGVLALTGVIGGGALAIAALAMLTVGLVLRRRAAR